MYYIGLMAGTSFDGVDCALVDANHQLIAHHYLPYPQTIRQQLKSLIIECMPLSFIAKLDISLANLFAQTSNELIKKSKVSKQDIMAIGSHGQTIYHLPGQYSWQIAHPAIIAEQTSLTVVADFRMSDVCADGQGAPLTPIYHQQLLKGKSGIIINLGGIANITIVQNNQVVGFDSGPANTLMDAWIAQHQQKTYDKNGLWANSGQVIPSLLTSLLSDAYFAQKPPKSTGFEYFNLTWLSKYLPENQAPEDVQATLLALTVQSIIKTLPSSLPVYLCGGGVHNTALVSQLESCFRQSVDNANLAFTTTKALGMNPDYLEAAAFAFFARQTLEKKPSNLPSVTYAKGRRILGGIYQSK